MIKKLKTIFSYYFQHLYINNLFKKIKMQKNQNLYFLVYFATTIMYFERSKKEKKDISGFYNLTRLLYIYIQIETAQTADRSALCSIFFVLSIFIVKCIHIY